MTFSTIIARNYLPHARVLARTLTGNNPTERLVVLVIDDERHEVDGAREPFDVLRPGDLPLAPREFHRMATIYDLLELSTAVKPWLLEHLLRAHDGPAIYLDPDIEVFASLDPLASLSRDHGIVLTPHTTTSIPQDGHGPSDAGILKAGVYNLGFIGVGQSAGGFLRWWQQRLRRDCLAAPDDGYAVDQKWIDLV
ncbi:MAG TPA: FkbM family methyltransferase, partial [Acidimicrobiia bacterium]|nr:FkbM family methyltransferase [Acidimicrobiia bacterium]